VAKREDAVLYAYKYMITARYFLTDLRKADMENRRNQA